uniref:DDE_Tnp_IS1595 domain-containing protein n=1 Tax=Anopheles albimanus TaxID=7167 RepID=A0A182F483_ANOAL
MDRISSVKSMLALSDHYEDTQGLVRLFIDAGLLRKAEQCVKCNQAMRLKKMREDRAMPWIGEGHTGLSSVFEQSKLTLKQTLLLIYLWSAGTPSKGIVSTLGLSRSCVYTWSRTLREIALASIRSVSKVIGGPNCTVEIDESCVTKRKYNRGRTSTNNQVWVVGRICRETKEFFIERVERRDKDTLHPIIVRNVAEQSPIMTDCWRAYYGLINQGFTHGTVNHSEYFSVENLWRWMKSFLTTKGTHRGDLVGYLAEFQTVCKSKEPFLEILNMIKEEFELS